MLKDYCLKITDGEHCSVNNDVNGKYYLLSNKNISNGQITINDNDRRISKDTFEKINKRCQLENGDVIVSTVGTLGKTAVVEREINFGFQRSVGIVKTDKNKLNPYFLKYLLDTPTYQKKLLLLSKGAIQRCLFIDDIKNLDVKIPSLKRQNKITSTLRAIDDKISLNEQINRNLEELARLIYDYWFVQFDFPDKNGKPYKSSGGKMVWNSALKREIPEGWEVKSVFDGASVCYGFPFSTEPFDEADLETSNKPISVIRIRDIKNNSVSAKTTENPGKKYATKEGDLLVGMDGFFHMELWPREGDYVNQRIVRIREKSLSSLIMLYQIKPFIKFKESQIKGSTVAHLSDGDIKALKLLVPNDATLTKQFDIILKKVIKNKQENAELTKLRNFLLPLLMNGQVSLRG